MPVTRSQARGVPCTAVPTTPKRPLGSRRPVVTTPSVPAAKIKNKNAIGTAKGKVNAASAEAAVVEVLPVPTTRAKAKAMARVVVDSSNSTATAQSLPVLPTTSKLKTKARGAGRYGEDATAGPSHAASEVKSKREKNPKSKAKATTGAASLQTGPVVTSKPPQGKVKLRTVESEVPPAAALVSKQPVLDAVDQEREKRYIRRFSKKFGTNSDLRKREIHLTDKVLALQKVSVIQTRALLKSSLKYRDNPKEAFRQTPLIRQLLRTKLRGQGEAGEGSASRVTRSKLKKPNPALKRVMSPDTDSDSPHQMKAVIPTAFNFVKKPIKQPKKKIKERNVENGTPNVVTAPSLLTLPKPEPVAFEASMFPAKTRAEDQQEAPPAPLDPPEQIENETPPPPPAVANDEIRPSSLADVPIAALVQTRSSPVPGESEVELEQKIHSTQPPPSVADADLNKNCPTVASEAAEISELEQSHEISPLPAIAETELDRNRSTAPPPAVSEIAVDDISASLSLVAELKVETKGPNAAFSGDPVPNDPALSGMAHLAKGDANSTVLPQIDAGSMDSGVDHVTEVPGPKSANSTLPKNISKPSTPAPVTEFAITARIVIPMTQSREPSPPSDVTQMPPPPTAVMPSNAIHAIKSSPPLAYAPNVTLSPTDHATYDITLYAEYDEVEMRHRADKRVPEWASNAEQLKRLLYVYCPEFMNELTNSRIFPVSTRRILYPGVATSRYKR